MNKKNFYRMAHKPIYATLDSVCSARITDESEHPLFRITKTMKNGLKATVITYRNNEDLDVLFENGEIVEHENIYNFLNCCVSRPKSCKIIPFKARQTQPV